MPVGHKFVISTLINPAGGMGPFLTWFQVVMSHNRNSADHSTLVSHTVTPSTVWLGWEGQSCARGHNDLANGDPVGPSQPRRLKEESQLSLYFQSVTRDSPSLTWSQGEAARVARGLGVTLRVGGLHWEGTAPDASPARRFPPSPHGPKGTDFENTPCLTQIMTLYHKICAFRSEID